MTPDRSRRAAALGRRIAPGRRPLRLTVAAVLSALSALACSGSSVEGPRTEEITVGVLVSENTPRLSGWPSGDALRVVVHARGAFVTGADVRVNGAPLAEREDRYEPQGAPDFAADSLLAIAVALPGFSWRDTLRVPPSPRVELPDSGADLRGCGQIDVGWTRVPGARGAWIVLLEGGALRSAARVAEPSASIALVEAPVSESADLDLIVLSAAAPLDSFRPDRPIPSLLPAGTHWLAWSSPRPLRLDGRTPLAPAPAETLAIAFSADGRQILWTPDTVRVHRLSVSTQFFAEGNLRWQITSREGVLPPVAFGIPPAGSTPCHPFHGEPEPLEAGVEYVVEAIGARHAGVARVTPIRGPAAARGARAD